VFHGRDEWVDKAILLLVAKVTARLAVLGPGGMGKTTIALALLHDHQVVEYYRKGRLFLSCEALIDADSIVVSLAKLLGISAKNDLLTTVIAQLSSRPRTVLVLDNLETVWLRDGGPDIAVDGLLGQLAAIPSLSLVITCRGTDLPQLVEWSNIGSTVLEPFSLEAALETFQARAGQRLASTDMTSAKELLNAVDRMPLAVSLLGQLARRGNTMHDLLDRWNRKRTALLGTHGTSRFNNAGVSIELSVSMVRSADGTGESLQLLSLCSMLPDGLRQNVFQKLRSQFEDIERARDYLCAYSLASLSADGVLKMLSPIRHHILERYPAGPNHHTALCAIYIDIAKQVPKYMDEQFKERAAVAAHEFDNLSSLLLTLVDRPTQQVFDAVDRLSWFSYHQRRNLTVALALVPHLEPHPKWKARCLMIIGNSQEMLCDYQDAIESLSTAAQLFLDVGESSMAAWCKCVASDAYSRLGKKDRAEVQLNEAQKMYRELNDDHGAAVCRKKLGRLISARNDFPAAIELLSAARQAFVARGHTLNASQCTQHLGQTYSDQGDLESAAAELEIARSAFERLGSKHHMADCMRLLGDVRRKQGNFGLAEELLEDAEKLFMDEGNRQSLALCTASFGRLRIDQGLLEQAIAHFKSAYLLYEEIKLHDDAEQCRKAIERLDSTVLPAAK